MSAKAIIINGEIYLNGAALAQEIRNKGHFVEDKSHPTGTGIFFVGITVELLRAWEAGAIGENNGKDTTLD